MKNKPVNLAPLSQPRVTGHLIDEVLAEASTQNGATDKSHTDALLSLRRRMAGKVEKYTHIVVPLDGSPMAEEAIPHALRFAQHLETNIVLAHVTNSNSPWYAAPDEMDWLSDHALAERYLKKVRLSISSPSLPGSIPADRITISVKDGLVDVGLLELTRELKNSLIVMATHGSGGLHGLVLGSVATRLLQKSTAPIFLICPPKRDAAITLDTLLMGENTAQRKSCGPLLVALDGSTYAEAILAPAVALAGQLHLPLYLIGVIEPVSPLMASGTPGHHYTYPTKQDIAAHCADAEQYLAPIHKAVLEQGVPCAYTVRVGEVAAKIAEYAAEEGASAVALTTHAHKPLPRMIVGSVADSVLRRTNLPVLMLAIHTQHQQHNLHEAEHSAS